MEEDAVGLKLCEKMEKFSSSFLPFLFPSRAIIVSSFLLLQVTVFFHPIGFRERVDQGLSHQTTDLSVLAFKGVLVYES